MPATPTTINTLAAMAIQLGRRLVTGRFGISSNSLSRASSTGNSTARCNLRSKVSASNAACANSGSELRARRVSGSLFQGSAPNNFLNSEKFMYVSCYSVFV